MMQGMKISFFKVLPIFYGKSGQDKINFDQMIEVVMTADHDESFLKGGITGGNINKANDIHLLYYFACL
jgi:hypothetical protein